MQNNFNENNVLKHIEIIKKYIPNLDSFLNKGASEEDLNSLEVFIGQKLPESFREFYKIYNGENEKYFGFMFGYGLLSIQEIIGELEFNKSFINHRSEYEQNIFSYEFAVIKEKYFFEGWLPFAQDGGGNFLAIDFQPAEKGKLGQIINFGRDEDVMYVIQTNFESILKLLVEKLRNGICVIVNEDSDHYYLECCNNFFIENDYYKNIKMHPKIIHLYKNRNSLLSASLKKEFEIPEICTFHDYKKVFNKLSYSFNNKESLNILPYLVNLRELRFNCTEIKDLSFLSDLPLLKILVFQSKSIDISKINNLKYLQSLTINETEINDFCVLSDCKELTSLEFSSMRNLDLSPLKECKKLAYLEISHSKIVDFSTLSDCKNLKKLSLSHIEQYNLDVIGQIESLLELEIYNLEVKSLSFLKNLKNLERLEFKVVEDGNYFVIGELKNLKEISCTYPAFLEVRKILGKKVRYTLRNSTTKQQSDEFFEFCRSI
ncbi:SMI1/KNR4 family protein [Pigmentibacter ruber]|uniref:SMI1/KNR4 family protein n=1 Tax=Pigmentibacter ruber TaxID=2683196 RepID=UPI00131CC690|nr:SMI1/KNR4 family protein [Pigmentibacter ruber]